jgi:hypothetical protein
VPRVHASIVNGIGESKEVHGQETQRKGGEGGQVSQYFNHAQICECLTFIFQSLMSRAKVVFWDAFGVWDALVPVVLSCTRSFAGCDFCLYFFATYNASVHPNVCFGGCALGTVGSCTLLVGQAIQETYKLIKNDYGSDSDEYGSGEYGSDENSEEDGSGTWVVFYGLGKLSPDSHILEA